MQNESTSLERELKTNLIKDINNLDVLLKLGEIYYFSGRLVLAKSCFSRILRIYKDEDQIQKMRTQLFITERDIQMNQNKIDHSVPDFLDILINELLEHSSNDYFYN